MGESATVFLVDDFAVVRQGLRWLLEDAGMTVVGEAASAAQAIPLIVATRPQVVVLDTPLPDGTEIELSRAVRSRLPGTVCLMLTSFDDDDALLAAMLGGAAGYIIKRIRGLRLVESIQDVMDGSSLLDPVETARMLTLLSPADGQFGSQSLTDRERVVLGLMTRGATDPDIASRLGLAEETVTSEVSQLLVKLGIGGGYAGLVEIE